MKQEVREGQGQQVYAEKVEFSEKRPCKHRQLPPSPSPVAKRKLVIMGKVGLESELTSWNSATKF